MKDQKKIFIVCGELSADQYGSLLAKQLFQHNNDLIIEGVGGQLLKDSGVKIYEDNSKLQVMGFIEVLKHYKMFKNLLNNLSQYLVDEGFTALILIDYPGFNLRLAEKIHNHGIKVFYYVCPHVWIWGQKRIPKIKKYVTHNFVIFPFEKTFFDKHQIPSDFLGHPVLDLREYKVNEKHYSKKKIIAILPGSRKNEIEKILPDIIDSLKFINNKSEYQYVISASSQNNREIIKKIIHRLSFSELPIKVGKVSELIQDSEMVIAASGTICLEAALFLKPMVVLYKLNPLTYFIAKQKIKIENYCIVNIIAGKKIVQELIQNNCNATTIALEVNKLLQDEKYYTEMVENLKDVKINLGEKGASERVAQKITGMIN